MRNCKETFARHGIPSTVIADNMPFASKEMRDFAKEWDFEVTISSLTYAQSDGQSERHIQNVKQRMRNALEHGKDWQFSVPQIEYPLGGSCKKGSHVYFLLQVFWVILLFCQVVLLSDINVVLMSQ